MKLFFTLFIIIFLNLNFSFAREIMGLNSEQKSDFNICLHKKRLDFNQVNNWENNYYLGTPISYIYPLYHNFSLHEIDMDIYGDTAFQDAIITSGIFFVNKAHSFSGSTIANVTFVGDFSKLDFSNACLVNVRFYNAGFFKILKIKYQAEYFKNISE